MVPVDAAKRSAMVDRQLRRRGISDERVLAAMGSVPREEFVSPELRAEAYADGALPIGHGQTISQPWVLAAIVQALELAGGERVLEVGAGSGYSTAVLAWLVRPRGRVCSYELVEKLAERARATLGRLGIAEAEVRAGDGAASHGQTWDAIAVHAAAPALPEALAKALRPGGRLVIPLATGRADVLTVFRRTGEGASIEPRLEQSEIAHCRFVPLLGISGFGSSER